jgi:hypothetical protein
MSCNYLIYQELQLIPSDLSVKIILYQVYSKLKRSLNVYFSLSENSGSVDVEDEDYSLLGYSVE